MGEPLAIRRPGPPASRGCIHPFVATGEAGTVKAWWIGGVAACCAGLTGIACGPPSIQPVGPPGIEFTAVTQETVPEDQVAEALGEARGSLTRETPAKVATPPAVPTAVGQSQTTPSGLTYTTLQAGTGATAEPGKRVTVHYTGTLDDGKVFDSSRQKNQPFTFTLGQGEVIAGWDQGVHGMKVGERRKLTVPGPLAYGANPPRSSPIPANATLTFDVELLDVK
jgi:FKBP-type peptidyl-prolyl cis-trans isomerase